MAATEVNSHEAQMYGTGQGSSKFREGPGGRWRRSPRIAEKVDLASLTHFTSISESLRERGSPGEQKAESESAAATAIARHHLHAHTHTHTSPATISTPPVHKSARN